MDTETISKLEQMDDGQLEELRARITSLQDKRLEEQVRRDSEERKSAAEEAKGGDGSGHVRWEMIKCGDCLRCKAGLRPHGPYLYRYYWQDGKLKSKYLGKSIKADAATVQYPEGTTPEDLDPAGVARAQADVARQWASVQAEQEEADAEANASPVAG